MAQRNRTRKIRIQQKPCD